MEQQAEIEFEITQRRTDYEYTRKIVQKICEDHEHNRNLRIKVILYEPYLSESSKGMQDEGLN